MSQSCLCEYVQSNVTLEEKVLRLVAGRNFFTVDDLHALEPMIERLHRDKRVLGAVLGSLKKKGRIQPCGYVKSSRVKCHHRPVLQWKVVQK